MDKRNLLSIVFPLIIFIVVFIVRFNKNKLDISSVRPIKNDKNYYFKRAAVMLIIGWSTPLLYFTIIRYLDVSYQIYLLPLLIIASLVALIYYRSTRER